MVTISNDGYSLGNMGGRRDREITGYHIVARVPHEWASKTFEKISGRGVGLTTAHEGITIFHISNDHPKFDNLLSQVIIKCADKEKDSIGIIDEQIHKLEKERSDLILELHGK